MTSPQEQSTYFNSSAFKNAMSADHSLFARKAAEFNPTLQASRSMPKVLANWASLILTNQQITDETARGIIRAIGHISKILYPTISTRSVFYSTIRKIMLQRWPKGSPIYQYSYKHLNLTPTETTAITTARGLKLMASNSAVRQVHWDDITRAIEYCRRPDSSWAAKSVLAELSSGARVSEILRESTFEPGDSKDTIKQIGIAKSKTPNKTVNKPHLFTTYAEFDELIKSIRASVAPLVEEYKKKHPDIIYNEITARLTPSVNKIVSTLIVVYDDSGQRIPEHLSSHDLRRIYASICWQTIGKKLRPMITQTAFLSSILGHDAADINTANSYTNIHVIMPDDTPPAEEPEQKAE